MNDATPFFLKTDYFLLIITLSLSATNIFAMNPSFPRPSRGEVNSDARTENQRAIEQRSVAREEEISNDSSSTEQRGAIAAIAEVPAVISVERSADRIGITPATLHMLRSKRAMESRQLPVAIVNQDNQAQIIAPENILNLISPVNEAEAGMVMVHPESEIVENNDIKPIAMSDYLGVLRKELKEQQGLPLAAINLEDDQQLEQDEVALNRVVLEDGITPEELRVLRALENYAISDSVFEQAHWAAVRSRLERDNNTSPHGGYMAQFQARTAMQNARNAALLAAQARQESENAIAAVVESERGYTPVIATPTDGMPFTNAF